MTADFRPARQLEFVNGFTPLEQAALEAILAESTVVRASVELQLRRAKIVSRENTGGGFFVDLEVDPDVERLPSETHALGLIVWIGIDGLELGLGAILHHKDGRVSLLEAYGVGPESTSLIDFARVRFAVIQEPGPLPEKGA